MKRLICAILAGIMLTTAAVGFSGCGCNRRKNTESNTNSKNMNGYQVPTTEPDLKDDRFGFYIINSDEIMLTRYYGDEQNVVIPETFREYTVTIIGHSVFHTGKVESVEIPDSVYEIQDYAFASNSRLKSVKLPSGLRILGTNVFFNCPGLTEITLPSTIEKLDAYTFCGAGLESIEIPESNTFNSLSDYMFFQCPSLKEVILPRTVTTIPDNCFEQCPSDMVIKAPAGSYSQSFAANHGINFEEIAE